MVGRAMWRAGLLALALVGTAPAEAAPAPELDRAIDPCTDFYQFACNKWIAANPIPADRSRWTRFDALAQETQESLHKLLDEAVAHPTDESRKIATYYGACMDRSAIEQAGLRPLQAELDRIDALDGKAGLPLLLAHLHAIGVNAFFDFESGPDDEDSEREIAQLVQGGLGLPDRDYYFRADADSVALREAYRAHVAAMLSLSGMAKRASDQAAAAILSLETALAKASLTRVERRDPHAVYHLQTLAALSHLAPGFDWAGYFKASGAPGFDRLNVAEPGFVSGFDAVLTEIPLDSIKLYLRWQLLDRFAGTLPAAFVTENFEFSGKRLQGQAEIAPQWRRCVASTDKALGEALGKLYVAHYVVPGTKDRIEQLIADLRTAFAQDIATLPWMGDETRRRAYAKLDAMAEKIAFPAHWRDYTGLEVKPGDALGNVTRAAAFETRRELGKIGGLVDHGEWHMTPPTINAYYSREENSINFPAGILQLPFFGADRDDVANYGAIGGVIGHEMTHGFDDAGRHFGPHGVLTEWWTHDDEAGFLERSQCFVDQYSKYKVNGDAAVNGRLTLGENTADNGGLRVALKALAVHLGGKKSADIDGMSTQQRFFVSFAQLWCGDIRPQAAVKQVLTDPHSPAPVRVNATLSNMPEFAAAFHCTAGAPMVPKQACRVW